MSTRIEVNISGFEGSNLKQKLDTQLAESRRRFQERQQLNSARKEGIRQARTRRQVAGLSPSGQVYAGKFAPQRKIEEIGPRRNGVSSVDIAHSRIFTRSSFLTKEYVTRYTTYVQPRPFSPIPFNFAGLYYNFLFGPNTVRYAKDANLYIWPSGQPSPVLVDSIQTSNPFDIPTYGNDSGGRLVNYTTDSNLTSDRVVMPLGKKKYIVVSVMRYWWLNVNFSATRWPATDGGTVSPPLNFYNLFLPYRLFSITGYSVRSDSRRTMRAFVCDEFFVKEVAIPPLLGNILDILYPSPELARNLVDLSNLDITPFSFRYSYPFVPPPEKYLDYYNVGLSASRPVTPSVFKGLNDVYRYTNQLLEFGDKNWILPDKFRDPGWFYNPLFSGDLYYAKWPVAGEEPSVPVDDERGDDLDGPFDDEAPELNLIKIDKPVLSTASNDPFLQDEDSNPAPLSRFHVIWDWGEPEYCEAMCRALGFREAELFL